MKRGRPRRFKFCPVCGKPALLQRGQRKANSCVNVYCECQACGARLRLVTPGDYWFRVHILSAECKKTVQKIGESIS